VLAAILAAGRGSSGSCGPAPRAYSTSNLESGWIPTAVACDSSGRRCAATGSGLDAGARLGLASAAAWIPLTSPDFYVTPLRPLGYGRSVKFDHDFLGREGRWRRVAGPRTTGPKVTLVWNPGRPRPSAVRSLCEPGTPAKYIEDAQGPLRVLPGGQGCLRKRALPAGMSLDLGYIANEHAFVSLATGRRGPPGRPGTEGPRLLWGERPNSAKPAPSSATGRSASGRRWPRAPYGPRRSGTLTARGLTPADRHPGPRAAPAAEGPCCQGHLPRGANAARPVYPGPA